MAAAITFGEGDYQRRSNMSNPGKKDTATALQLIVSPEEHTFFRGKNSFSSCLVMLVNRMIRRGVDNRGRGGALSNRDWRERPCGLVERNKPPPK